MSNWDFTVFTGNPEMDRMTVENYRQAAAAQGLQFDVQPLPQGGFQVRAWAGQPAAQQPPQAAWGQPQQQAQANAWGQPQQQAQPNAWGQPQQQAQANAWGQPQQQAQANAWGQPQQQAQGNAWGAGAAPVAAMAGFGGAAAAATSPFGAVAGAAESMDAKRVAYLRKVYSLLGGSALFAIVTGMLAISVGPTQPLSGNPAIQVPIVVSLLLETPGALYGAFALLFAATFVASWVSKVKGINVIALFAVAGLMGIELAPMAFVAQVLAGMGQTMTATPVRDAFIMVGSVFAGITTYIYITKKDFSYLRATLSMGFFVIFAACIMAGFLGSEVFSLAVASAGALLSIGFLLYVTSYIFRNSEMDDPVGDALAILVQLRNLFMFLLRIFMSSRD